MMAGSLDIAGGPALPSRVPIEPEGDIERRILDDRAWQRGVYWGRPRPGHPEGTVLNHVRDVLGNVDRFATPHGPRARAQLRLVALLHDSCKFQARLGRPGPGGDNHGLLARRFAERFVSDEETLELIELHDEACACWQLHDAGRPAEAHRRAQELVARLGGSLALYRTFLRCNSATGDGHREPLLWFDEVCAGLPLA